jgi:hypothetical protein
MLHSNTEAIGLRLTAAVIAKAAGRSKPVKGTLKFPVFNRE